MESSKQANLQKARSTPVTKKSILVIDDNADILDLARNILKIDEYEIFTAQSGKEAFKILSEINRPDLILLDMQMYEMNGADFLLMLNEKMPELIKAVPVVFLTGMDQVPKSKAMGFIRKPIQDISTFLENIRRFIESGTGHAYDH